MSSVKSTCNETTLAKVFESYSRIIDEKNDKYEVIYKINRDITVKSKRIIFTAQRLAGADEDERAKILLSVSKDLKEIDNKFWLSVAKELSNEDQFQFVNAYSAGLQEYIEALTFYSFLNDWTVITYPQVQERLCFTSKEPSLVAIFVPFKEYILGMADFTGEIMRFSVKCLTIGEFDTCIKICNILKEIYAGFVSLGHISLKEMLHKVFVLRTSLEKVEDTCYLLHLRKSELPPNMLGEALSQWEQNDESYAGV